MRTLTIARNRPVHLLLILSMLASFFVLPQPAKAGILGSFLSAIRPLAKIAGKVGGAIVGASLCSAFVPPLGLIAGGIAGWIAGGIITSYGTASLANLATLGGAAVGAMALGPGAVGLVGGALLGGFLGRTAMKLLQKGDRLATGGILLKTGSSSGGAALAPSGVAAGADAPTVSARPEVAVSEGTPVGVTSEQVQALENDYRAAYQDYISATQGGDAANIKKAHESYLKAYNEYKLVIGKDPK